MLSDRTCRAAPDAASQAAFFQKHKVGPPLSRFHVHPALSQEQDTATPLSSHSSTRHPGKAWPLRTRGGKSSPASPRVSTKPQDGTESGPGQQVTSHPPRGTHPGQAALTNHPAVGNLACNVAATKRQPLLLTSPHSGAGTIPLIKESWPPKSRSESHTVRAGLGPVSVLHGMSGSLPIKEKNQDSVLYQIPILHHRQRAEEAQEGKGPRQASHKAGRAEALRNQPGSQRRNRNPQVQSQQGLGEAEA